MDAAETPAPTGARASAHLRGWRRVLLETAGVGTVGLALALVANGVSPRGLTLGRDYFPRAVEPSPTKPPDPATDRPAASPPAGDPVASRLAARGLGATEFAAARSLFDDPRREQELIVFVDARNDDAYQAGHIPGAYQFDRYYPEKYLPAILPACLAAEIVVVYCTGGNCEDSEFAALALLEAGVAPERLVVFVAGMEEWRKQRMPVEVGVRGSGEVRTPAP